ncbi:DUF5667 domain-containing protein [Kitasatospora camelliae]|uniref:DUF5667 domain-containing protein n=1 Tax=Kitasatospora camelliae TaxID=3156397 RepID=A0AAU8JYX6_9ACTN
MTANVLEHRRAKAFAEALEAHQAEDRPGGSHRSGSAAMAELLAMADTLGALPEPELSVEARTVQRARLMAAFEREWAGGKPADVPRQRGHRAARSVRRSRWGRRLAIGGLVAGVAVGGFAGAAAASTDALPGDALYGVKRGLEGFQLDWAGSDSERGALLLKQASTRLDEAQSLLERGGGDDALSPETVDQVRRALDDMHAEALRGRDLLRSVYRSNGSLAPMQRLATFADGEDARWTTIQGRLPGGLAPQAGKVDRLFDDISEDVAPLRLDKPVTGGQGGSGAGGGQQAPGASGGSAQTGQQQPAGGAPTSRGGGGTGGAVPGAASPGTGGNQVGQVLGGILGGGTTPTPAQPGTTSGSAAPSAPADPATPEGQGLTIPPLVPGLLPGLTLG